MEKITLEKTHTLLERLSEHVMNNIATKQELDEKTRHLDVKIAKLDEKIDRIAKYVLIESPIIHTKLEQKADKIDIQRIPAGQDELIKQVDIFRTEQYARFSTWIDTNID